MTVQHFNLNIMSYTMEMLLGTLCKTMQQDAIRAQRNRRSLAWKKRWRTPPLQRLMP
jgi:hypothetical protein